MDNQTIERIKKGFYDCNVGPETIALMPTDNCNFSCVYCRGGRVDNPILSSDTNGRELSTEELFSLFEDACRLRVREINLGGMRGEPFCRKDILPIMSKIKQIGFLGSMTTNGSLLNSSIAAELSGFGWDILLLSLDSPNAALQHSLRPAVNKREYFGNIIEFLDTLEDRGSKLRVLLNMVITARNYKELPAMVKFANSYRNIESINLLRLVDMGLPDYGILRLDNERLKEFNSMLRAFKDEKKIMYAGDWESREIDREFPIDASHSLPSGYCGRCFTNYYILSIDANGYVLRCPQQYKVVSGLNVRNTPLNQLWKKEHLSFREALAVNAQCFAECCTILKEQNKLISKALN